MGLRIARDSLFRLPCGGIMRLTNPSTTPVDLTLDFTDEQGLSFSPSTILHVDAMSHLSLYITQLPFSPGQGSVGERNFVRISSPGPAISVVGLLARYNERGDFLITTTPAIPEDGIASTGPLYIPHIVDGGGYTTQLVLFPASGQTAGTTLAGTVEYFHQSGTPMVLPTR